MNARIEPVAGGPHFSLASLAQITFWVALASFFAAFAGLWALIAVPLLAILLTLLIYERNTRPLMFFVTVAWRVGWLGVLACLGYSLIPA